MVHPRLRVSLQSLYIDKSRLVPILKFKAQRGINPWGVYYEARLIRSLYERYRFSSEGIRYLVVLVGPYVGNATKRSRAQCVCVSLRFVATGTYLHTVGDAERISKKVPSDTQGCSCPKYTAKYVRGVSQLFANTNCQVASYQLAGKRKHLYT
ncbi:hypothetical protein N1851_031255 [Merluccius polli]|uniref:Uncharacterized protein n=1 Tax=Merluccius polli TaxID=89951 RepID=A0AA47M450_MERPO|nr:hypothetical protein N1851_031255 [Merluccius polli]